MSPQASDICGLGLIMPDFLLVRSCKCEKCYCFNNFTNKETEALHAYTICVSTVTAGRDWVKSKSAFCRIGWTPSFDMLPDFLRFPLMFRQCGLHNRALGSFSFMVILTCSVSVNTAVVLDLGC